MEWIIVLKNALGWIGKILVIVMPYFWKVSDTFGAVLILIEKSNVPEKKKEAIDAFENFLVKEGYISSTSEKAFDPVIDWILNWIVDLVIGYLNKNYGHDWINKIIKN